MTKIVTYQSDFYHNGHSQQRDRMLIEMYGEQWLKDMKAQGYYGGDWPEEIVGTEKIGLSGYYDENGELKTIGEVVKLNSLQDLERDPS